MSDCRPFTFSRFTAFFQGRRAGRPAEAIAADGAQVDASSSVALEQFVVDFGGMVRGMEERFVPLGQDMGSIVRHLQSLAQVAGEGFGTIRRDLSHGSLGELDTRATSALSSLKEQLGSMSERMQPLAEVESQLQRLRTLGNEVKRIGAFLQACGSSFAVESARREESRAAFAAFVEELRGLAAQIGTLAERMSDDSHSTLAQLTSARRRIRENVSELDRLAGAMHGAFTTAAGEIQQLLEGMRGVLDRVEHHRTAIAAQTGAVIYYLQFGDIVRQKCEHVLAAACEAQEAAHAGGATTLPIIVRTAAAQLEMIHREVAEARTRLGEGYAGLESELAQLADCGRALSDAGKVGAGDAWSRLKARLQDLESIQLQEARLNGDAMKTASEAGASAAALHAGLGSVREMSCHLHMLALNAIIQTAHLGIHGRTLEELAQHVDGLHRTCETIVPQVLEVLNGIAHRVASFTDQSAAPSLFDLDGVQQLERAQHGSHTVMSEILSLAADGEDLLRGAVQRLATLNILAAEIETHRDGLLAIGAAFPAADTASTAGGEDFDHRMLARYTMQSERDAHLRSRGLATAAAVAAPVELFTDAPGGFSPAEPELVAAGAGNSADDLGDNIELF